MKVLNLIGMGPGNPDLVTAQALNALKESDVIIGAKRAVMTATESLERFGNQGENGQDMTCLKIYETFKTDEIISFIENHAEYERFSAVFTGDTSVYSGAIPLRKAIGEHLALHPEMGPLEVRNIPGVSSIQYFLSKSGISMADVRLVSLHGQARNLVPIIRENKYTCVLLGEEDNVARIADKLVQFGLTRVQITVGERLSYEDEHFTTDGPREMRKAVFDRLAIALFQNDDYRVPIRSYGIAEEHFQRANGVPITKRDVRALSICRLALRKNSVVYDIGAGTGSVSIEAALACPEGMVISVEYDEDAAMTIERNRYDFKIDNVKVIRGMAPECIREMKGPDGEALPVPDSVFIGGSKGHIAEIVDWAVKANPQVVIVINAITLETIAEILSIESRLTDYTFEMVEVHATSLERRGSYHMHQSENPITITRISHR